MANGQNSQQAEPKAANVPNLTPQNLKEAIDFCERLAKTNFVPKDYQGKPGEILAAIQFGAEVGLGPMQSLQSIAVINGRPSLWGDALLGLVQGSGLLEWINETETADSATCEVKRKGDKMVCKVTWTHADTIKAGLASKDIHAKYPKRMRANRARNFALRNKFADVLKGLISREEAEDYPTVIAELTEKEAELAIVRDKGPFEATGETIVEDHSQVAPEPDPDAPPTEQEMADLEALAESLSLSPREMKRAIGVATVKELRNVTRAQLIDVARNLQEAAQ